MITKRLARIPLCSRLFSSKPPSEKIKEGTPEIDSVANEKATKLEAQKKLAKEEMYMEKKASEVMDNLAKKKKNESKGIFQEAREWLEKKFASK